MSDTWRGTADGLVKDLQNIFSARLRSVVAYGPHLDGQSDAPLTCLVLVESLGLSDLDACARSAHRWHRHGLATPLVLPEGEFQRSLDAFPLEYGEIIRAHQRVFGPDPFEHATVTAADLRRACETQVKSHLLHLREEYIEAGGSPAGVAQLVAASAPAFASLLRNVARMSGATSSDRRVLTMEGARAAGLDEGFVGEVLALEQPAGMPAADGARLFPTYLTAVEKLARFVDTWRA